MLDYLLNGTIGESLTLAGTLTITGSALLYGLLISVIYMWSRKEDGYAQGFAISLIMLPAIIAMIILLIGNNVARAFSLTGAFSLIRFRSAPGDSKDISYVFFALGVGLACGMGYIGYAAIFAIMLCGVMIVLTITKFGRRSSNPMLLKITLPENMEYYGVFDKILGEYTDRNRLLRVKTAEFGSLFELNYEILMKDMGNSKELIDRLRCKNGNLNIMLAACEGKEASAF